MIIIFFLAGCATIPIEIPEINDNETFQYSYDKVWGTIVESFSENSTPIDLIDKDSGLINTGVMTLASGMWTEENMKNIVIFPNLFFLRIWEKVDCRMSFYVSEVKENQTKVKISIAIMAYEGNVTKNWHKCYSTGEIEKRMFDRIRKKF
jgi:hypothetical protein